MRGSGSDGSFFDGVGHGSAATKAPGFENGEDGVLFELEKVLVSSEVVELGREWGGCELEICGGRHVRGWVDCIRTDFIWMAWVLLVSL